VGAKGLGALWALEWERHPAEMRGTLLKRLRCAGSLALRISSGICTLNPSIVAKYQ